MALVVSRVILTIRKVACHICYRDKEYTHPHGQPSASMAQEQGSPPTSTNGESPASPLEGGCSCKHIRYRMVSKPLIVHACHCRWCQRETGSAFAINAMIEANRVVHLGPEPLLHTVPSESGDGQTLARCPKCNGVFWSNYEGPLTRYVRVGTLDQPARCPPDVHIFTISKQPWLLLSEGVPALERTYERKEEYWSEESMKRLAIFDEKVRIWQARKGEGGDHDA